MVGSPWMPESKPLHEANFFQELAKIAGPCLIAFGTPFCGACQLLHRLFDTGDWPFPVHYLDAGENPGLIQEFEIFHFPKLLLFIDGEPHASIERPLSIEELIQGVQGALDLPPSDDL